MAELFRYAAFISYSSRDAPFAQRLHRALEAYAIPKSLGAFDLIGGGKKNRIYPIFRDREELAAKGLGEQIAAALDASAALIVVCSPNSVASPWVQQEIDHFIKAGRRDCIFAIIPDTAPLTDEAGADATGLCLPPAIRGDGEGVEQLAADARKGRDGFRNAWLKLVAGMIGLTPGQIIDRDKKRRRQRALTVGAGVAASVALLGFVGAWGDAQVWRTRIAVAAQRDDLNPAEALPLALAAVNVRGGVLGAQSAQANTVLAALGRARRIAEYRGLAQGRGSFSNDGAYVVTNCCEEFQRTLHIVGDAREFPLGSFSEPIFSPNGMHLLVVDGRSEDGLLYDLRERELTPTNIGHVGFYERVEFSPDGEFIFWRSSDGRSAALYDIENGTTTSLPITYNGNGFVLPSEDGIVVIDSEQRASFVNRSGNGESLAIGAGHLTGVLEQGAVVQLAGPTDATFLDLRRGGEATVLAGMRPYANSVDGHYAFIGDGAHGTLFDVREGIAPVLQNIPASTVLFAFDGGALVAIDADNHVTRYSLTQGLQRHEAGTLPAGARRFIWLSANGDVVFSVDQQSQLTTLDLRTRNRLEFGRIDNIEGMRNGAPDSEYMCCLLSDDGSNLVVMKYEEPRRLLRYDALRGGAPEELGKYLELSLSNQGSVIFTLLENRERLVLDMADGAAALNIGRTGEGIDRLSDNGDTLLVSHGVGTSVFDTRRAAWEGEAPRGERLARTVCDASGRVMRSFAAELRNEGLVSSSPTDAELVQSLKGRPWNPCDWRGLLAVLPDAHGAGWFEGLRQWVRLMHVRYFPGGRDYQCGEVNAAGQIDPERVRFCRERAAFS